ncbi:thioredoxin reductase [Actinocorallia herbida]|uniref:Thioredoxin reductase n=1 Tax=Actinocorallia herbida TaxID=58109 RepID=A0A3N1CYP9_9ACTN|nr:NAD(P)/FAD-dependent oxidoreductase [Actinocorallia herbida]ROO86402.1 thioredoxin reductase [Actinocorallia herbida]
MNDQISASDTLGADYEAVVIGGGAAGLSGGLMLARARRSVAVIDAGEPRNAPAEAVHGLFARDGVPPAELLARGRAEVRSYGGHVASGEVAAITGASGDFTVALADGRAVKARRILVATGLVDELPDMPGLLEQWGRGVVHCPYCHGWEIRDEPIGVLGVGPMAVHQALLFRQWTADVTLFTHTAAPPTPEQAEQLTARGIAIIDGEVTALEADDGILTGVRLADGTVVKRAAVAVGAPMRARADFLAPLGLAPDPHPSGMGEQITADPTGRTAVPGVFVAGNVSDLSAQVGGAAAAAALAAAHLNADLITEETDQAVTALRART